MDGAVDASGRQSTRRPPFAGREAARAFCLILIRATVDYAVQAVADAFRVHPGAWARSVGYVNRTSAASIAAPLHGRTMPLSGRVGARASFSSLASGARPEVASGARSCPGARASMLFGMPCRLRDWTAGCLTRAPTRVTGLGARRGSCSIAWCASGVRSFHALAIAGSPAASRGRLTAPLALLGSQAGMCMRRRWRWITGDAVGSLTAEKLVDAT